MTSRRRSGSAVSSRAAVQTATVCDQSNRTADELAADKALLQGVDGGIWAAIFDGKFKLAVRCEVCGRWLTAAKSKNNGRGPSCAARSVKR